MNPRKLRLGFIMAGAGTLLALLLPLSADTAAPLQARPILLALTIARSLRAQPFRSTGRRPVPALDRATALG